MVEFYDREEEIEKIMSLLKTKPNLITFVYGPINSGKTELMNHLIRILPKEYRVFYINLRGIYVGKADDFLKVLFEVDEKEYDLKEYLRVLVDYLPSKAELPFIGGIPVPKNLFKRFFEEREVENVFKYVEKLFLRLSEKFNPVLIIDELQVIGDIKIDDLLIYKLFNLFIRLTKELHCCHVFAVTSDSLFIERVYSEAMLQGRCRYLLVDDFDFETTKGFLRKYGFSKEEVELTWNYFGGKPVYLVEAIRNKSRLKEFCEEMLRIRTGQIEEVIFRLEVDNKALFKDVVELLREIGEMENVRYRFVTDAISFLVKNNVIFADPATKIVKPQSKLDLLAIKRVLEEVLAN
jgi:AAA+ ATPase superfamily predicted ATPase